MEGISKEFAQFTEIMLEALSDRVSVWITFNEVASFIGKGYMTGEYAPFESGAAGTTQAFQRLCRLTKNVFVAHGKAVRIIRKKAVLPPKIGIAMDGMFFIPWEETEQEIEKARKRIFPDNADYRFGNWWLDPVIKGRVSPDLANMISNEEEKLISQPLDFIGYNCYKANNYDDDYGRNEAVYPGMPRTAMDWPITPDALYWAVRFIRSDTGFQF